MRLTRILFTALLFSFLLSLAGILEPVALAAAGDAECCCPGGAPMCPMRGDPCSFRSGCGPHQEAPPAPLTLFCPPASAVPLVLASGGDLQPPPVASPNSTPIAVPNPPPRA